MISSVPAILSREIEEVLPGVPDPSAVGGAERSSRLEEIERFAEGCRGGDSEAWEALFGVAWPVLVTFIHRLYRVFDQADAEDIAQASLSAAVGGIRAFTGKGSFRGWLFGIAAKQAASFHRTRSALKRGAGLIVPFQVEADLRDEASSPAEVSAARDRADLLHRALEQLDEIDRDLVQLHYFGELTFKEIAAVRQMNPKTVGTRLARCKEKLLIILGRSNLTHADG